MLQLVLLFFIGYITLVVLHYYYKEPPKVNGVYSQPTVLYPFKFHLMKFVIGRRQKKAKAAPENDEQKSAENLINSEFGGNARDIRVMERKHKLPADAPRAGDCVYFNATNADGWYFTLGMAMRPNDTVNLFFILTIPNVGCYVNEELYTNTNVPAEPSEDEYITKSGFRAKCIKPMAEWAISFDGNLVEAIENPSAFDEATHGQPKPKQLIPAKFELIWKNHGSHFDFDVDVSPAIIARSIALETWTKELFERLRETHQTHYEQYGHLSGSFSVGNSELKNIDMLGMRDHTITKYRNWSNIRRYIMIMFHLEDGTCVNTSLVSMPETVFTHLHFGYIVTPKKGNFPVDSIQLELYDVGENKSFPKNYKYSFVAGGETYYVEATSKSFTRFKMGLDQQCYVEEHQCEFVVNGQKGYGFSEAEYRIEPYDNDVHYPTVI